MKKVIIACDSFKGSMDAVTVCNIIKEGLQTIYPDIQPLCIPLADGGEGTVDAYLSAIGGEKVYCRVHSPLGNVIEAYYGKLNEKQAIVECAQASGIAIEHKNDPMRASSYGTGELIRAALDNGAEEILIGLGGSAMTDGGIGLLAALGIGFFNENGEAIIGGGELAQLYQINTSNLDKRLKNTKLTVLCDVTNPLYGFQGAAYVYAGQKGANKEQIEQLDRGLRHFSEVCIKNGYLDYSNRPGTGAAGGCGFGLMNFTNASFVSGIDAILSLTDFRRLSQEALAVITGEGKIDSQSIYGKVLCGVSKYSLCSQLIAVCGLNTATKEELKQMGLTRLYETNPEHLPFEIVLPNCKKSLFKTAQMIKFE